MTKNTYLIIGLIIVLLVVGFVFVKQRGGNEALAPTGEEISETAPASTLAPPEQAATKTVTYTNSGFSPQTSTIKAGDTVVFKNMSDRDFRPASAVHPTHEIYPEFNARKAIPAGSSYSFTFTRVGSWKYHNHLNPSDTGTITVQ